MTRAEEYLHLFEQRRLIDRRLSELAESFADDPTGGPRLPKSGLRIVATVDSITTIDFHGDQLFGFQDHRGGACIALRPVVEGMGLNWSGQLQRVRRDPILSEGVCVMHTPSDGGMQESVCLPLELFHGFLFRIDAARVDAAIRDRVLMYQRDCYAVLARAFAKRDAAPATPPLASPIDTVAQDHARKLVSEARHLFGDLAGRQLWFKLGLPIVPAMYGAPAQLGLDFTYTAHPHHGAHP